MVAIVARAAIKREKQTERKCGGRGRKRGIGRKEIDYRLGIIQRNFIEEMVLNKKDLKKLLHSISSSRCTERGRESERERRERIGQN